MKAVALAVVVCAAVATTWWYLTDSVPPTDAGTTNDASRSDAPSAVPVSGTPAASGRDGTATRTAAITTPDTTTESDGTSTAPGTSLMAIAWPVAATSSNASAVSTVGSTAGSDDPDVAIDLAFKALNFVGVDAEAEKIWLRAINDPRTPAGVRSDLIEDLNDEGYVDNSHPGKEDLDLILARMRLIEKLAPTATDPVNAAAFEEAYKDLLAMYVRLGGTAK